MFKNIFKKNTITKLGRWGVTYDNQVLEKRINWANHDHCGSEICEKYFDNETNNESNINETNNESNINETNNDSNINETNNESNINETNNESNNDSNINETNTIIDKIAKKETKSWENYIKKKKSETAQIKNTNKILEQDYFLPYCL